ncbi:MAG: FtsX-like permease family protein [Caulobacteraceae bacterium]
MRQQKRTGIENLIDVKVSQLSEYQKQLVSLARAVVNTPAMILADDPVAALEPKPKEEFMKLLYGLNQDGISVIVLTEENALPQQEQSRVITLAFSIAISVVSLIIGCIGIMNLMLLSLSERKKEIGFYKLYGAGIREIQYVVMFKSLAICIICGLLGMAAGIIAGSIIGSFINVKAVLTFNIMALTLFASAVAGVASGLYPVVKAAAIDTFEVIWGE